MPNISLEDSADLFAKALRRCTTLCVFEPRMSIWPGERYATLVNLRSGLSIDLCLGSYYGRARRSFWLGFTSTVRDGISSLVNALPAEMHVDPVDIDPPHELLTSPSPNVPVAELRSGGWLSALGIYSGPGVDPDFGRALTFVCRVLRTAPGFETSVSVSDEDLDIVATEVDRSVSDSERKLLINARRGQGRWRDSLDQIWSNRCAVSGITHRSVLRGSHVKPWRLSSNKERLDPQNGLLLAAHLDSLFDKWLITFSRSGKMIIADEVSESDRKRLNLGGELRQKPSSELTKYLDVHRNEFAARHPEAASAQR